MSHVRTQVRDKVVAILNAAVSVPVYPGRVYPTGVDCICVYTQKEACDLRPDMQTQQREVNCIIEGRVKSSTDVDKALDNMAVLIETAIAADPYLSGISRGTDLSETEKVLSNEAEKEFGSIALNYTVYVLTTPGAPGSPL